MSRTKLNGEQIAEEIRSDLLSQRLAKGAALREQALARRFGVSRMPVRDALLQLTREGLLVAQPNKGVKVASETDRNHQRLIVKIRRDIEAHALELVFARIDEIPRAPIQRILKDLKVACQRGDVGEVVPCDLAFHRFFIDEARQGRLVQIWLPIVSQMMMQYGRHREWMDSYREHVAIADAIFDRDKKKAKQLLMANIT